MNLETHSQSQVYDVEIGGYSLKLRTNQKQERVEEIVKMVEDTFKKSLGKNSNLSVQKALILSCLNIAESHYDFKQETKKELDLMELRVSSIKSLIQSI